VRAEKPDDLVEQNGDATQQPGAAALALGEFDQAVPEIERQWRDALVGEGGERDEQAGGDHRRGQPDGVVKDALGVVRHAGQLQIAGAGSPAQNLGREYADSNTEKYRVVPEAGRIQRPLGGDEDHEIAQRGDAHHDVRYLLAETAAQSMGDMDRHQRAQHQAEQSVGRIANELQRSLPAGGEQAGHHRLVRRQREVLSQQGDDAEKRDRQQGDETVPDCNNPQSPAFEHVHCLRISRHPRSAGRAAI